jgi:hypothetical protein
VCSAICARRDEPVSIARAQSQMFTKFIFSFQRAP